MANLIFIHSEVVVNKIKDEGRRWRKAEDKRLCVSEKNVKANLSLGKRGCFKVRS